MFKKPTHIATKVFDFTDAAKAFTFPNFKNFLTCNPGHVVDDPDFAGYWNLHLTRMFGVQVFIKNYNTIANDPQLRME